MKFELLLLGKTKDSYLAEGITEFTKRLQHYTKVSVKCIQHKKKSQWSEEQEKEEDGRLLLSHVPAGALKVILDFRGRQFTSEGLADLIGQWEQQGVKQVSLLIGGPLGHAKELVAQADLLLSLSQMTFTHDMTRLFLLEQLYRAYTIKAGEKYHK
ncbi:MAG: 23S rRNA (pseudouridine(1915)-N(3))-methyltransferase RlmH [Deltaproteobacteria bacterium]|nr:23S rRNA (pseudouridine(1915)-N(3))-methyltransferase RlmH [Deltaproteobacteria bacterium]